MYTIIPTPIISVDATSVSVNSSEFRGNQYGCFSLDIRANHGSGTQNLAGTFYLRHRNSLGAAMSRETAVEITAVAGVAYRYCKEFSGAHAGIYDVEFARSSGTGDIDVDLVVPGMK
jgi:hypothetical protein